MKSYNYAYRQGVLELSWIAFARMAQQLSERLEA